MAGRRTTFPALAIGAALAAAGIWWLLAHAAPTESGAAPLRVSEQREASPPVLPSPVTKTAVPGPFATASEPPPAVLPALPAGVGGPLTLSGRVVDADGQPLADADVWFVPSGPTLRAMGFAPSKWERGFNSGPDQRRLDAVPLARVPHARTRADGRFSLSSVDVPSKSDQVISDGAPFPVLVIVREGCAVRTIRQSERGSPATDVGDIALDPEIVVVGRTVDDLGQPLPAVAVRRLSNWPKPLRITVTDPALEVPELFRTVSGTDGRFTLRGLSAGQLELELRVPGRVRVVVTEKPSQAGPLDMGDVTVPRGTAIDGLVVDEQGAPVAGAEILLSDREIRGGAYFDMGYSYGEGDDTIQDELSQVRCDLRREPVATDAAGRFHAGGLDAANYTVYAVAHGFEPVRLRDVGAGSSESRLVLQREAVLLVDVRDAATGAPLPEANLQATRLAANPANERRSGVLTVNLEVLSGADAASALPGADFPPGRFLVRGVGSVGTQISAVCAGRAPATANAPGQIVSTRATLQLDLPAESSLAGHVRDGQGAPVPRATVLTCTGGKLYWAVPIAVTDDSGAWQAHGLGAGPVSLVARAEAHAESDLVAFALGVAEAREGVDFVLPAPAVLRGRVLHADGSPWAKANVSLDIPPFDAFKPQEVSRSFEHRKSTDADGRCEFGGLRPGSYRLSAHGAGAQVVELAAGDERSVDLTERPSGELSGTVTSAGQPLAGVTVSVSRESSADGERGGGWIEPVKTDAAGRYTTPLRGAGDYEVEITGAGYLHERRLITVGAGESAVLDLSYPAGSIAGRITSDVDGSGISGAEIEVLREDSAVLGWAESAPDGSFRLAGVPAGTYRLQFNGYIKAAAIPYSVRFRDVTIEVSVAEGQAVTSADIVTCPGGSIAGAVTLPNGVAVKDGTDVDLVLIRDGASVMWPSFSLSSGGDIPDDGYMRSDRGEEPMRSENTAGGRYEFGTLPAGRYLLLVRSGGSRDAAEVMAHGVAVTLGEHGHATQDLTAQP